MSQTSDTSAAMTAEALAHLLERDASTLMADTHLSALGVDSVALVMWADLVEGELRSRHGFDVVVPDSVLRGVHTVGDLSRSLEAVIDEALRRSLSGRL
jgi:acyl carrier protein